MSVRKHPTNPNAWYIDVGYGKNRERIPFEGSYEEALLIEEMHKKKRRGAIAICADPVNILIDKYLECYRIDHLPSGYEKQYRCCKILKKHFGKYLIQNFTTQMVENYKIVRVNVDQVKPSTVQKELCALSSFFRWAEDSEIIKEAPCRIKKFRTRMIKPPAEYVPTKKESEAIINQIPIRIRGLFHLMLNYGLRKNEALTLKSGAYNSERRLLTITGKGGTVRDIPIVDETTHEELKNRSENAIDGWLWYSARSRGPYSNLSAVLKNAAKRAGFEHNIHKHLFRHSCFTDLVGTADIKTVQSLAGHVSITTTEKYLHKRADRMRTALELHMDNGEQ